MIRENIFILLVVSLTISGKTILITDDPKLDYDLHDFGSTDRTLNKIQTSPQSVDSTTVKLELEIEENLIESGQTPSIVTENSVSNTPGSDDAQLTCSLNKEAFNNKISKLAKKFAPNQLKLKPIIRGMLAKVHLENGVLNVKSGYKILGQPFCKQLEDNTKEYDFMLSFDDLMGSYEWKLYNLFGYNFSEIALISVKQIITELVVKENASQRTKLHDLKVGRVQGMVVNVNIPENISQLNLVKYTMQFIVSRISTIIAHGSMSSITKNLREVFVDSIREKVKIRP